jgi:hypothetical protein
MDCHSAHVAPRGRGGTRVQTLKGRLTAYGGWDVTCPW